MKANIPLTIEAYLDLYSEKRNGILEPVIIQSFYMGKSNEPFLEEEITLSTAIESLIKSRTLVNGTIRKEEKEFLLSELDSMIEVIQKKKAEALLLQEYVDTKNTKVKSKKKKT